MNVNQFHRMILLSDLPTNKSIIPLNFTVITCKAIASGYAKQIRRKTPKKLRQWAEISILGFSKSKMLNSRRNTI